MSKRWNAQPDRRSGIDMLEGVQPGPRRDASAHAQPRRAVGADDKPLARLNLIQDILGRLHDADKKDRLVRPETNDCLSLR